MSQYIRKFEPGGSVSQIGTALVGTAQVQQQTQPQQEQLPIMFNTANDKYDARELAKVYEKNIPLFAQHLGLKQGSKKYRAFLDAASGIQTGLVSGDLKRGEGLKYTGSNLDDSNKMQSYALGLLDKVLQTQDPYREKKKEKQKYSFDNMRKFFWNRFYGGREDADLLSWYDRDKANDDGVRANTNRANALADMLDDYSNTLNDDSFDFEGSAYKDLNDYKGKLKAAADSLRDGTFDNNDAITLDQIGFGKSLRDQLLGDGSKEDEADADPNSYLALLKEKKKELDADLKAGIITREEYQQALKDFANEYKDSKYGDQIYSRNYQNWANSHWNWDGDTFVTENQMDQKAWDDNIWSIWRGQNGETEADSTPAWLALGDNLQYALLLANDAISGKRIDFSGSHNGLSNSNILRGVLYLLKDTDQVTMTKSGNYYINETFNYDNGTALMYNPSKKKLVRVHVDPEKTPELYAKFKAEYQKKNPRRSGGASGTKWTKNGGKLEVLQALRKGGIVKALDGSTLSAIASGIDDKNVAERYARYVAEAQAKGMSLENVIKGKQKSSNSGVLLLRNISTGLDVASGAASFIPVVGNAIGAIGGTIGTIGNLAADAMDDTVSSGEMYKNLALNAGMTGLMLIPGGGVVKAGKALVGAGAAGLGAWNVISNWDRIKELRAKADAGKLSHDERRELDAYYSMAAGAVTGAKGLAGQAAAKTGSKALAAISDPLLGISSATGNRKAKVAFAGLTKDLVKTPSQRGLGYNFVDKDGNSIHVTGKLKSAMTAAFKNAIKQEGATSDSINEAVGKAWAKEAGVDYALTKNLGLVKWSDSFDSGWLKAADDPTAEITLNAKDVHGVDRDVTLSVADQKKIRLKFTDAANVQEKDVMNAISKPETTKYTDLSDADKAVFDTKKAEMVDAAQKTAVEQAFESLPGTKPKTENVGINPNAPVVMPDGWTKKTGWKGWFLRNPQMGDFEDSVSLLDSMKSDGYSYDPRSKEGVRNLKLRSSQRAADKAFLDLMHIGSLMNYLNTNWEMAHGMGAYRGETDKRLDKDTEWIRLKQAQSADPNSAMSRNAKFSTDFETLRQKPAVLDYLKKQEQIKGSPLTEIEKATLAKEYVMGRVDDSGALVMDPKILEDVGFSGPSALAGDRLDALREHYSKLINPDFDPAAPIYASDRDIALRLADDMKARSLASADLAEELIANKNLGSYKATYGGADITDDALLAAGINKKQSLALYARDHGIAATTDSDDIAINKLSVDPMNISRANSELDNLYSGVQVTNARNAWKTGEGASWIREAEGAGRTLSDVDVDLLRSHIDNNNSQLESLINAERAAGRDVDPAYIAELKSIVASHNQNFARTGATSGSLSTDLTTKLGELRADAAATTNYNNKLSRLSLTNDEVNRISDYIDTHEVPAWRAAGLSDSEILKRKRIRTLLLGRDKMLNKQRVAKAEAAKIKARKAAAEALIETDLSAGLEVPDDATKLRVLDGIDALSSEFADMLPGGIASGMHDQINAYILQELKNGSKIGDIRTKFEHAARSSSARNALLDNVVNADDTLLITVSPTSGSGSGSPTPSGSGSGSGSGHTYTGTSKSGVAYNWSEPAIPTKAELDPLASVLFDILSSVPVDDADVIGLAKFFGFNDPVDINKFKHFISKQKRYSYTDFSDRSKIPLIARFFEKAKYRDMFRLGGKLNDLKRLRNSNFTTDDIKSSLISSNKNGGIVKAADGDKVVLNPSDWQWYSNLYSLKELGNPDLRSHNQNALSGLTQNNHNENFDLGLAALKNDAYTASSQSVGDDLLNYYNSAYGQNSIDDYITNYNKDANTIRGFWGIGENGEANPTNYNANTDKGDNISTHNRLFRSMFGSRSQASTDHVPSFNIGYQDNLDNTMGTSTWMRRMDRYKTEWDKDTDEGKFNRVHAIKLGNGQTGYVYKKANGDIAKLDDKLLEWYNNYKKQKEAPLQEKPVNPEGSMEGSNSGLNPDAGYKGWKDKISDMFGKVNFGDPELKANMMAIGRYLSDKRNNRRVTNMMLKLRTTLGSPLDEHAYVRDGFSEKQMAANQAALIQSLAGHARSSDASLNTASMLSGAALAADINQKADMLSNNLMRLTSLAQLDLDQKMHLYNVKVKDSNNAALAEMFNKKQNIKASALTANQTNKDTLMLLIEYNLRKKGVEAKDLQTRYDNYMDLLKLDQAKTNDPEYQKLRSALLEASTSDDPKVFNKALADLKTYEAVKLPGKQIEAWNDINRAKGVKVRDLKDLRNGTSNVFDDYTVSRKSGGTITDVKIKREKGDADRLMKSIADSIKTLEKSLDRLSKSLLLAILKYLK